MRGHDTRRGRRKCKSKRWPIRQPLLRNNVPSYAGTRETRRGKSVAGVGPLVCSRGGRENNIAAVDRRCGGGLTSRVSPNVLAMRVERETNFTVVADWVVEVDDASHVTCICIPDRCSVALMGAVFCCYCTSRTTPDYGFTFWWRWRLCR